VQEYASFDEANIKRSGVAKIDLRMGSITQWLNVLGMPGMTGYFGLMDVGQPKAGETVVVSGAAGSVGQTVGQLAKIKGCRVVGIAGGPEKCHYVTQTLGFDACIDHRSAHFASELAAALPSGIDCLFENVGGAIFETLLTHMNVASRIALCGMVSEFNRAPHAYRTLRSILINRIRVQGFIVSDKLETWPAIRENLYALVVTGKLQVRESITEGLAHAPEAFVGLLKGENFGKQLIKLT
jgi:NADPH-dependent curcumin reductase CurA